MAKSFVGRVELDEQVERYFKRHALSLKDIFNYSIHRNFDEVTRMTLEIYIDHAVFDKEEGEP